MRQFYEFHVLQIHLLFFQFKQVGPDPLRFATGSSALILIKRKKFYRLIQDLGPYYMRKKRMLPNKL